MKKSLFQILFTTTCLSIVYLTNTSYSSGPPTSAPAGGCVCHGPASSNTIVSYHFNNGNMSYINGLTYPITVTVRSNSGQPYAGFALRTNIGTFGLPPMNTTTYTLSGWRYWTHDAPTSAILAAGYTYTNWTINWTAPTSGNTPLTIQVSGNAVDGNGDSDFDQWATGLLSANFPLPVAFHTFKATRNQQVTNLYWSVGTENNVKEYQIQSSMDGTQFTTIGTVNAKAQTAYSFLDKQTYQSHKIYYRIKSVDVDGHEGLSNVELVSNSKINNEITIYPTLLHAHQQLNIDGLASNANIILLDALAHCVFTTELTSKRNTISLPNLPAGIYFAFIKHAKGVSHLEKIIIQ